eukprot:6196793-Pleurochrysis_carterae.AAC.1
MTRTHARSHARTHTHARTTARARHHAACLSLLLDRRANIALRRGCRPRRLLVRAQACVGVGAVARERAAGPGRAARCVCPQRVDRRRRAIERCMHGGLQPRPRRRGRFVNHAR